MSIIVNKSSNSFPEHKTRLSAGFDIASNEDYVLKPKEIKAISTGLFLNPDFPIIKQEKEKFNLSDDFRELLFLMIVSRSGLAKEGIVVNNSPAIIDLDYPNEIFVILRNQTEKDFHIKTGMRIAQGIFVNCLQLLKVRDEERKGGFGSTNLF